ncbi:hypothetical protein [Anabaena sp. UHCC 0253]|nr:hypothetical protein [Anabaena sp. UHCC 0253]
MIIVDRYLGEDVYSDIQAINRGEKLLIPSFPEINLVVEDILGFILS